MRLSYALSWILCLGIVLFGLLDLLGQGPRFTVDTSPRALLDPQDAAMQRLDEAQLEFSLDPQWLLALPLAALDHARLAQQLGEIHYRLSQVDGIRAVDSLASAPLMQISDGGIDTRPLTEHLQERDAADLLTQARLDPFLRNQLISADGQWLAWALTLAPDTAGQESALLLRVRQALTPLQLDQAAQITGASLIESASGEALLQSLNDLMPRLLIAIAILVLLLARRIYTALICTAVMLGTLAAAGLLLEALQWDLNLVTALLPPLLVSLAVGYGLYAARAGSGGLGLAALTTATGFAALALTPVPAVQQFALLAAAGTAFVWLNCHWLLLAWPDRQAETCADSALLRRVVAVLARIHRQHRRRILLLSAALALIATLGIPQLRPGSELAASLPPQDPVRLQFEHLNQQFGGLQSLQVLIHAGDPDAVLAPAMLQRIDALDQWLEARPEVSGVQSVTDLLKLLTQAYTGSDSPQLPDSSDAAMQYLWLGGGSQAQTLVNQDYSQANLIVRTTLSDTAELATLAEQIEQHMALWPGHLGTEVTGESVLLARTINTIAAGQVPTIAVALLAIYLGLSLMFTSFSAGLLALIPNILPVLLYFGGLGYAGIALSPATSLVACIVIGLAVDNTIHYFTSFNHYARATGSETRATRMALAKVLGPASTTTAILCTGFALLALDPLPEQARFGLLAAATLACAWLNDLLLTPALASGLRVVSLWDLLRLDLGDRPQEELPLMHGLTTGQARTLALMLDQRSLAAGDLLMQEGETGDEFYLVLEGQLEVSVDREGEKRVLGQAERGALIGEAGFLGQARSASVQALQECRLLRTDAAALERLRQRYPRIAAIVYRNLHRSLAQRFAANIQLIR